jgi:hypothetical protein
VSIPSELLYLLAAIALALLLYRYFTGRGGLQILRPDYEELPDEGHMEVRQHLVRWRHAGEDAFVVAWEPVPGQLALMRIVFDGSHPDEPDLGHVDVRIGRREVVRGAAWTEKIRDRALRDDVEAILRGLQAAARRARSDRTRIARARPVGDDRREQPGPTPD